jgi:hypothetical protein
VRQPATSIAALFALILLASADQGLAISRPLTPLEQAVEYIHETDFKELNKPRGEGSGPFAALELIKQAMLKEREGYPNMTPAQQKAFDDKLGLYTDCRNQLVEIAQRILATFPQCHASPTNNACSIDGTKPDVLDAFNAAVKPLSEKAEEICSKLNPPTDYRMLAQKVIDDMNAANGTEGDGPFRGLHPVFSEMQKEWKADLDKWKNDPPNKLGEEKNEFINKKYSPWEHCETLSIDIEKRIAELFGCKIRDFCSVQNEPIEKLEAFVKFAQEKYKQAVQGGVCVSVGVGQPADIAAWVKAHPKPETLYDMTVVPPTTSPPASHANPSTGKKLHPHSH